MYFNNGPNKYKILAENHHWSLVFNNITNRKAYKSAYITNGTNGVSKSVYMLLLLSFVPEVILLAIY